MSCQGPVSSEKISQAISIVPLFLELSISIVGSFSISDIVSSPKLQQQLVDGVADAMGVPSTLVQLAAFRDVRRRLLAVSLTFRILASSTQAAASLQTKAATANFQGSIQSQGINLQVSTVNAVVPGASVPQPSPTPQSSPNKQLEAQDSGFPVLLVAAVAGSAGSLVIITVVVLFCVCRKRKHRQMRVQAEMEGHTSEASTLQ